MKPEDVRAFVDRDWDRIRAHKRRVWAELRRSHGPGVGVEVAERLRQEVLRRHGSDGLDAGRAEDLARHVRVHRALRSVSVR
jgi:kynurenine formamidase